MLFNLELGYITYEEPIIGDEVVFVIILANCK